jgi:hypothetical protein
MAFGDEITLSVEVTDFETTKGELEISGTATQNGGAFATFSKVVDFDKEAIQTDDGWFVDVTAKTIPPTQFDPAQEITVFVRVARVWVTVLGQGGDINPRVTHPDGGPATHWGQIIGSSQLTKRHW